MRNYFIKIIVGIVTPILLSSFIIYNNSNICLQQVDLIFKKMYSDIPLLNNTTFVNYEVTTKARKSNSAGGNAITKAEIKYYTNKTTVWFISDDLCMYKDNKYTFTVIPKRKVIYWAETAPLNKNNDRYNSLKSAHDSIFKHCKTAECKTISDGGKATKLVTITLEQKWVDLMQIKSISYYIDDVKNEILKQNIEYTDNKKIEFTEYVFKEVNYDYKKINIETPVKNLFIKTKNTLIAPYNTFQLIDVRKNK